MRYSLLKMLWEQGSCAAECKPEQVANDRGGGAELDTEIVGDSEQGPGQVGSSLGEGEGESSWQWQIQAPFPAQTHPWLSPMPVK